jgi:hypothetical protein
MVDPKPKLKVPVEDLQQRMWLDRLPFESFAVLVAASFLVAFYGAIAGYFRRSVGGNPDTRHVRIYRTENSVWDAVSVLHRL